MNINLSDKNLGIYKTYTFNSKFNDKMYGTKEYNHLFETNIEYCTNASDTQSVDKNEVKDKGDNGINVNLKNMDNDNKETVKQTIITNPDGSRSLLITYNINGMVSTCSIKLNDNNIDSNSEIEKEANLNVISDTSNNLSIDENLSILLEK